jgi:HEAT repeat protein
MTSWRPRILRIAFVTASALALVFAIRHTCLCIPVAQTARPAGGGQDDSGGTSGDSQVPAPPPEEPEPQPTPLPPPPLVTKVELGEAELARLIEELCELDDSFVETYYERKAGRVIHNLVQAGRPAWDLVCQTLDSEEDEFVRARLNAVLACMRWKFSPYTLLERSPYFLADLYTREEPPKREWYSPLETFFEAGDAPRLVQAFAMNDPEVSYYACEFLEKLGPVSLPPLLEAISDDHPYFHFCVSISLMRVAPRTLGELRSLAIDEDPEIRARAIGALGLSGVTEAVPALSRALSDQDVDVRMTAAYMLSNIPDRRAVGSLVKALDDSNAEVAVRSAEALGVVGDASAIEPLAAYIRSGRSGAEAAGTRALAGIGDQAAGALLSFLKDGNEDTRAAAATALGQLHAAPVVEGLVEALSDSSETVRSNAAFSLGYVGGARAKEAVLKAAKDPDGSVRQSAAYALGRMGAADCADVLGAMLDDADGRVRLAAISSLARVGGGGALAILIKSLDSPELGPLAENGVKAYGAMAVPGLTAAFGKSSKGGKCTIIRLLAQAQAVDAVPILTDGLGDPDLDVRYCAQLALKMITGHETSYQCDGPDTERARGIEEWRDWWKKFDEERRRR